MTSRERGREGEIRRRMIQEGLHDHSDEITDRKSAREEEKELYRNRTQEWLNESAKGISYRYEGRYGSGYKDSAFTTKKPPSSFVPGEERKAFAPGKDLDTFYWREHLRIVGECFYRFYGKGIDELERFEAFATEDNPLSQGASADISEMLRQTGLRLKEPVFHSKTISEEGFRTVQVYEGRLLPREVDKVDGLPTSVFAELREQSGPRQVLVHKAFSVSESDGSITHYYASADGYVFTCHQGRNGELLFREAGGFIEKEEGEAKKVYVWDGPVWPGSSGEAEEGIVDPLIEQAVMQVRKNIENNNVHLSQERVNEMLKAVTRPHNPSV